MNVTKLLNINPITNKDIILVKKKHYEYIL